MSATEALVLCVYAEERKRAQEQGRHWSMVRPAALAHTARRTGLSFDQCWNIVKELGR